MFNSGRFPYCAMITVRHKILAAALVSVLASIATFAAMMIVTMRANSQVEEAEQMRRTVSEYNELVWIRQRGCEAVMQSLALRADVRQAMATRNRDRLIDLIQPTFIHLQATLDVSELTVYLPDGTVLLRADHPGQAVGQPGHNRPMTRDAAQEQIAISGIEIEEGRLTHHTIVPAMEKSGCVGLIETGFSYDESVLGEFRARRNADSRIWLTRAEAQIGGVSPEGQQPSPVSELFLHISTFGARRPMDAGRYRQALSTRTPSVQFVEDPSGSYSSVAVPIIGYKDRVLGVLEISRSRAMALAAFRHSLLQTLGIASLVAVGGIILIAATLNFVVLRPLRKLTDAAHRQYEGHLAARVEHQSSDEFGLLARTFNSLSNRLTTTLQEQQQSIDELRDARQAAEQANAAKDQFLAALSHELRTPLTPVLLAAETLDRRAGLAGELAEDVRVIRRNVQLEARLIDDLLDLTRIAQGKLELRMEPCDVHPLLTSAIAMCKMDADAARLEIATHFDASRHWVQADSPRLQQVFWNLVKNAVKFTPPGGRIEVRTSNESDAQREYLVLEVIDTGIGINPSALTRIFNLFEQGSRSITQQFGGLGLGLAISRRIVEMHNGRIGADSLGPGKGSTFTVFVPTIAAPAEQAAPPARRPEVGSLRLLVIEDHATSARAMQRLLVEAGHRVVVAGTVAEALRKAAENPIDMVISDLGLPDGDGADLMAILREKHNVVGIAVSGYGMRDDIARTRAAGFASHLIKPFTTEQLFDAIASAVAATTTARP